MKPAIAPPSATTQHLALSGIHHRYGTRAVLHDVAFTLAPGELLCLVGPSGCGKSTLLRLIAGLEPLQAGSITLAGRCVAAPGHHVLPEQRDVGLVFQDFALFPHLTLMENVAFGLGRLPRAERAGRAGEMLARVGLAERATEHPHMLSGGQQQRVALARALAPGPRLVLLDEPFSNLDVRLRHRLRDQTLALLRDSGTAAVLVTHDAEEAMYMADHIALLQEGRIVQMGSPEALYHHPVSPFAAEFFGEVNRLQGVAAGGRVATPFGPLEAPALADGVAVEVLLRPEALEVVAPDTPHAVQATVREHHMLGAVTLLLVEVTDAHGHRHALQAQVPSAQAHATGQRLCLCLRQDGAFVFAASA